MDSGNIKSVHLLQEIMEEILSRLPVKSLLRFRCVSKSWLSLISSERFIEAHRQNSTKNRHHNLIFVGGGFKQCSVQQLLNEPSSIKPCRIQQPTSDADVLGCCNGLICLLNSEDALSLWNPVTMIFMELPKLKLDRDFVELLPAKYGLGWDGKSGAYKVFVSSTPEGISKGNVYSSKTNSWKTVEDGCLSLYDSYGVFACGKINWVAKREEDYDCIESFDLGSDEFGWIKLPFKTPTEECRYKLAEIGGCLHLLCVHVHDKKLCAVVWVMKESAGWLKLFTNSSLSICSSVFGLDFHFKYVSILFGGGPNGEIFLMMEDSFLVYDGKDVIVHRASDNIKFFHVGCVYLESLVSPKLTIAS